MSLDNKYFKLLPVTIYFVVVFTSFEFLGIKLFVRQMVPDIFSVHYIGREVLGYYFITFILCLFPLVKEKKLIDWFYVALCLFVLFQLEYKFLVWLTSVIMLEESFKINLAANLLLIALFSFSFKLTHIRREAVIVANLAIFLAAASASYHSYWIWSSWNSTQ